MAYYRPSPHTYTVSVTVGGVRATARSYAPTKAIRRVIEMIAANRTASEARIALAKKATARLLKEWRDMGRPDAIRIRPGHDCPVRAEMERD